MSAILFIVGAIALMVGVAMIGFGIPVNEFSFGNTLIVAGTTAAAGGLVVIGLGAVVAQLQRIADGLSMWTPAGSTRMAEMFEPPHAQPRPMPRAMPPAGRVAFPPRPQPVVAAEPQAEFQPDFLSDPPARDVPPVEPPVSAPAPASEDIFAGVPSLRNPDLPPVKEDVGVPLSPTEPSGAPAATESDDAPPAPPPFGYYGSTMSPRRQDAAPGPAWRPPPPPPPAEEERSTASFFDSMWPKRTAAPVPESQPALVEDLPERGPEEVPPPAADAVPEEEQPAAVAILKSGVVDGMGYTLYVDGSIEAELPHGTLRFSSINDLRNYLEKNA